jgi:EpsI family protein
MAAAGLLLIVGNLGGVALLQELSLIIMIAGLVALLLGGAHLKALALPIAYLLFMVKLFGEGGDSFHWPFQLLAADIGVWLLHLFGYSAHQDGIYIHLPRITLEVASACSGVRFLVSIIAIGIPLAYLTQRDWLRRVGLVAFAVVIAILANGLRVALIGVWTYGGDVNIHGPFHILYGTLVSWVGFIALFAGAWFLGRSSDGAENRPQPAVQDGEQRSTPWPRWAQHAPDRRGHHALLAAMLVLAATGGYYFFHTITPLPPAQNLNAFPTQIGEWLGEEIDPRTETLRVNGADTELVRRYRDRAGRAVTLYIGYFDDQTQGKELVGYKTSWKFHRHEAQVTIPVGPEQAYRVNRAVLPDENGSRAVFFWYDLNGRVVANRYEAKLWTIWDALTLGRTNGATVAISIRLDQNSPEQAFDDAQRFIRDTMFFIKKYLPSK